MRQDSAKPSAHARHVAKLCECLFAPTAHLHGLTKPSLRLLQQAALTHDLGAAKTTTLCAELPTRSDTLFHHALAGLAADERRLVAHALAAFHLGHRVETQRAAVGRGRERAALEIAWRLGAILRIADALDRSRSQRVDVLAAADDGAGVEILVSGGQTAAADARAALQMADLWNAVALRPVRAVRIEERAGGLARPVSPGGTVAEVARRLLSGPFEQFVAREHGLAYERDIEYVHEMRVALRRFLAVLRVTRTALDIDYRKVRDAATWLVDALGVVRDFDVFVAFLRRYAREAPGHHQPVVRRLIRAEQQKRRRGYRALLDLFESDRYARVRDDLRALFLASTPGTRLHEAGEAGEETVARYAPRALRTRLKRVLAYRERLDLLAAEDQHALRIACKRLRYTAEIFGSVYVEAASCRFGSKRLEAASTADGIAEIIGPMVKLQAPLGDVHDADVYRERIEQYARRHARGRGAAEALAALLAHLDGWRAAALRKAASVWLEFRARKTQRQLKEIIDSPMAE